MLANKETKPPEYFAVGTEIDVFEAASRQGLPLMLKGPTGCGKTRFVEYMAHKLNRPLISVTSHEDVTASDLVGRYLLKGGETVWEDGPLTRAAKAGAICYLDEIVEARADAIVAIHSLTDHRRELHIDRLNQTIKAHPDFMIVISYNPGYQSLLKELKQSTRQRMIGLDFDYPPREIEEKIVAAECGLDPARAAELVQLAHAIRRLDTPELSEGASTRTLISAGLLHRGGCSLRRSATAAISSALTDDVEILQGLNDLIELYISE